MAGAVRRGGFPCYLERLSRFSLHDRPSGAPVTLASGSDLALPATHVEELIRTMVKGLRAFQMYLPNNPMYQRAEQSIREAFLPVWSACQQLVLSVVETDLVWEEKTVYHQPRK